MNDQDSTFRIARTFAAPRSRVWAAWTEIDQIAQWFGPRGSDSSAIEFDLRPGGVWRGRMDMEGMPPMFSKFVFREIEPETRLSWIHGFADADGNRIRAPFPGPPWPLEMLTTVTFADEGDGTKVVLTFTPIDPSAEERATFIANMDSMRGGWGGSFDELEEFLG